MSLRALWLRNLFWLNDWRKGSPIRSQYREIKFIQEHSAEVGATLRKKALVELLHYAQSHTDFYAKYTSLDLCDYPVMNKLDLLENYDKIRVKDSVIPGQRGPVHVQSTSGSTGSPFKIHQDTVKRNRRIAELKYFGEIVGYKSHDELVHLRAWNRFQSKTAAQIRAENIMPFDLTKLGDDELREFFSIVRSFGAVCLRGYASAFGVIADYAARHADDGSCKSRVRMAIAGSEKLDDQVRRNYKKYIGGEIISQYANEECGVLAQERIPTLETDNPMYLNHSGYWFELLKINSNEPAAYGEMGRIVITDLHNHAFPLIRYETGDVAIFSKGDAYSNGYPVMTKLFGRKIDLVYNTNGDPGPSFVLGREFKHYEDIRQWQFAQVGPKSYEARLVVNDELRDRSMLIEALKNIVGKDADITICYMREIPILASGKRKMVVNEWKCASHESAFAKTTADKPRTTHTLV